MWGYSEYGGQADPFRIAIQVPEVTGSVRASAAIEVTEYVHVQGS